MAGNTPLIPHNKLVLAQATEDYLIKTRSLSIATANAIDAAIAAAIVCILPPFRVHDC
jgi:hypothetical protein